MSDISNLRSTIVPKSDQLNAEQLLSGDMTITVRDVRMGSDEQPVIIHYDGEDGRPYKPAKTVRKLLIFAWGEDGREWIGKSMTLYNDQAVRFGGMVVGGIRISHLSHIEREISLSLTATKGKKAQHTVLPLEIVTLQEVLKAIADATSRNAMNAAKVLAMKLTGASDAQAAQDAFNARMKDLKKATGKPVDTPSADSPETAYARKIAACQDTDALDVIADEMRELPEGEGRTALEEQYRARRNALA